MVCFEIMVYVTMLWMCMCTKMVTCVYGGMYVWDVKLSWQLGFTLLLLYGHVSLILLVNVGFGIMWWLFVLLTCGSCIGLGLKVGVEIAMHYVHDICLDLVS